MKLFQNQRVKGAVSIFLIMILLPTMIFSAVLIDGSRLASAKAMAQEATDLAAVSALASYNQELKDNFGLFAINDNEKVEEIYKESLTNTLLAHGLSGDAEYSERIWEILKTSMTGGKSYAGESFLNLYDFSVEEGTTVETKFCLAEKDVLESQMVEYAKFRGLYVMMDRLDILLKRDEIQKSAEENKEASEVMEKKMGVDEANAAVESELEELRNKVKTLNDAVQAVQSQKADYLDTLTARMKQIRVENTDTDEELSDPVKKRAKRYKESKDNLKAAVSGAQSAAGAAYEQANKVRVTVESAIKNLGEFKEENGSKAANNETVGQLMTDADKNIADYNEFYLREIDDFLKDTTLKRLAEDQAIGTNMDGVQKKIDTAIEKYIKEIEKMREEESASSKSGSAEDEEEFEITEYYFYYLSGSGRTTDESEAVSGGKNKSKYYKAAVTDLTSYFEGKQWNAPNPTATAQGSGGSSVIDEDFVSKQSEKAAEGDKGDVGGAEKGKVADDVYKVRPSVKFVSEESGKESGSGGFYDKKNKTNLSASKKIVSKSQNSMLLNMGETVRDDVLCLTYMFGTFKTRLTGVNKFTAEGMSQSDKDSFYMPKWRWANEGGEMDLRFSPKKDRSTVLRSEIEYLVYGNQSDTANEAAVYATIMGERLANNVGAMYLNKTVSGACHSAAIAASALTEFLVPETVFFWIFLTAWATAETVIEMDYLISGGYKVPLLKTKDNLLLADSPSQSGTQLISHYGEDGIFVTYEDYLLILLLLKGSETRVMRTADLIEMNMKKNGQSDFTMAEAYTTLHADTRLSIRYLFGSVMPFQSTYEGQGFLGRIYFTDTIYQSY